MAGVFENAVPKRCQVRDKVRVLIVDDSAFARFAIARELRLDPAIEVVDFASDGVEAVEKVQALRPDVVTLDVEMPRMDGLGALERIMTTCPTPVVMLSGITSEGAEATIRALELGAVDFFLKPWLSTPAGSGDGTGGLRARVMTAAAAKVSPLWRGRGTERVRTESRPLPKNIPPQMVAVIGSSTGGPRALYQLMPDLPADIPAAVLVVQHMPAGFTKSLAERLGQLSAVGVREAAAGDVLREGEALIAPGNYHMTVTAKGTVELNQGPQECGVRPSVNVTMESAARAFGAAVVGVVLTGMGADGTRGAGLIRAAGGKVVVQDESTCTIYGMPKSAIAAGNVDLVVPLPQMAAEMIHVLKNGRGGRRP